MGRFLKPDNLITNAYNPQSWNLYSYVRGNPVNFNDPTGHNRQGIQQQTYIANVSGATWIDWKSYLSFYGNLYGGNVSLNSVRGGGGTGKNGYWQWVYPESENSSTTTIVKVVDGYALIDGERIYVGEDKVYVVVGSPMVVYKPYLQWVEIGGGGDEQQLTGTTPTHPDAMLPISVFRGDTPFERFISAQSVGFNSSVVVGLAFAVIGGGVGTLSAGPAGTPIGGGVGFLLGFIISEGIIWEIAKQPPKQDIVLEPPPPGISPFRYQTISPNQPQQQQAISSGK